MNAILMASQWKPSGRKPTGDSQPPRNRIEVSVATRIMLAYSARKNSAKAMPEYSTMWPATISDSPSTTSKGARLVSATPEIKYTTNIGSSGIQFQDRKPSAHARRTSLRPGRARCR
jgi:hypothetical protein